MECGAASPVQAGSSCQRAGGRSFSARPYALSFGAVPHSPFPQSSSDELRWRPPKLDIDKAQTACDGDLEEPSVSQAPLRLAIIVPPGLCAVQNIREDARADFGVRQCRAPASGTSSPP